MTLHLELQRRISGGLHQASRGYSHIGQWFLERHCMGRRAQQSVSASAYKAQNIGSEPYNSNQAAGGRGRFSEASHFGTPIIGNGKVYSALPAG